MQSPLRLCINDSVIEDVGSALADGMKARTDREDRDLGGGNEVML